MPGRPITTAQGLCFAFPDVCNTPTPVGPVPTPYPNTGQLAMANPVTTTVFVGGQPIVTSNSMIPSSMGDEGGSAGGVTSGTVSGPVRFVTFSQTVSAEGGGIVRQFDTTQQNNTNAVGFVLGGNPNVLVGD